MLGIEYLRKTTGKVQTDIKNKNMVPPFKMKPSEREKKNTFAGSLWLTWRKTNLSTTGKHESYWSCPLLQLCSNFHNLLFVYSEGEDFITELLGNYHKMMAIVPGIGHFAVMVQTVKWHIGFKYFHRSWKVTSDKKKTKKTWVRKLKLCIIELRWCENLVTESD